MSESQSEKAVALQGALKRAGRARDGCLTAARWSERISRMTSRPTRSGRQGSNRRVVRAC
jgi:hypothetical protein